MAYVRNMLLTNWHFMRVLRIVIGAAFGITAFNNHDSFMAFAAALFLFQGITNTGCCGAGSCATSYNRPSDSNKIEDTEFEEIKAENNGN